ncbi:MAG: 3-deoxy-manno-octulosonate cytidylyltransferase [Proteobacteria bacterium]|nr:3-deoxy-manno-octulosonate cytidylyltransferase [Pseudomonadota bacterium]MDA0992049.1 3-deoxy-manno-octulosonate cytidylyltransferase [Pseudomonadota bacterium]
MNDFVVVIPARYASTRLPGKPLRLIAGEPMIWHVHQLALRSSAKEVWIATDDERIEETALGFGAKVCMTRSDHRSGTDRLAEVSDLQKWPDDLVVVNLQGDEPLMPPELIDQCAALLNPGTADMATLASSLDAITDFHNPSVVKVIVDRNDDALYFSRAAIPHCREEQSIERLESVALRHHGIYTYRRHVLRQLVEAGPCALEQCEMLEQLRALWLGITLRVGRATTRPGPGVDTEEDLSVVEAMLKAISE